MSAKAMFWRQLNESVQRLAKSTFVGLPTSQERTLEYILAFALA